MLIVGDVMVDSYIWGRVDRISPEAPVPVVSVNKKEIRLGGAANVAKNILALGATPILCSVVGQDDTGNHFLNLLHTRHMDASGIVQSASRITTEKMRILSSSQQMLRIDNEITDPISPREKKQLLEKIDTLLEQADVVIFEDYDKGVLSKSVIRHTIDRCLQMGIPTVVDPKKRNFHHYEQVSLFKPNIKEIKEGLKTDADLRNDDQLARAVAQLRAKLHLDMAFITRSELGVYIDAGEEQHFVSAHVRAISDVSGAGDTVVSTAALCLALGMPPKFIAELSNLAGGMVCEHLGVVPVDRDALLQEALTLKI